VNLSFGFVLGSLLFLTPALVLIAAMRIYYPIHGTISFLKQGLILPAAALVISTTINGSVFLDWLNWSLTNMPDAWDGLGTKVGGMMAGVEQVAPHRPGLWLMKHVMHIVPMSDYNILGLILDVHLRVLITSVLLIVALKALVSFGQFTDTWWYIWRRGPEQDELEYQEDEPVKEAETASTTLSAADGSKPTAPPQKPKPRKFGRARHAVVMYLWKLGGSNPSKFIAEKSGRPAWNPRGWVQYVRDVLYHPWALITAFNPQRDVLMVDVMTKTDNLYTGMFTQWLPQGEEAAAGIAMQYILRHKPNKEEKGRRKIVFIENNGEMVFPMGEIANLHFWEIRRRFDALVTVNQPTDLEIAKWYLALNEVHPKKFRRIVIEFQDDIERKLASEFVKWIKKRRLQTKGVEFTETPAPPKEPEQQSAAAR
jgi:hypothetical protein